MKCVLQRGIDVIVELDTPGHTTSIALSHPEFIACPFASPWGQFANGSPFHKLVKLQFGSLISVTEPPAGQLRLANPDTIKFTTDLVKNIASMFPSQYFNTGGDEINANCYAKDNQTQQELGMLLLKWMISVVMDTCSCSEQDVRTSFRYIYTSYS